MFFFFSMSIVFFVCIHDDDVADPRWMAMKGAKPSGSKLARALRPRHSLFGYLCGVDG